MRFANLFPLLSLAAFSLTVPQSMALTPSRAYAWSMDKGNLLPNWSFENMEQFWLASSQSPFSANTRFRAAGVVPGGAKTGSFVAMVSGATSTSTGSYQLTSERFPLVPGQTYTLSFYYQTSALNATLGPRVDFYTTRTGSSASNIVCPVYSSQGAWKLYSTTVSAPANAVFASLTLAATSIPGSGTLYFDDVLFEEGSIATTQILDERARITESMVFGDGLGRTLQSQTKIAPGKYLVGGTGFDRFGRPDTTFLPFPVSQTGAVYNGNLLSGSKAYNVGGKVIVPGMTAAGPPDAGGYPFSEVLYSDDPASRVLAAGAPGPAWQLSGAHTTKKGFYFTSFLLQLPANIENPSTDKNDGNYRVDWVRDPDSNFTLTFTNRLGQVSQVMHTLTHAGLTASWKLSATQYEYYPDGRLRRIRTPLDVQAVNYAFAEVYEFNTIGQMTSKFTPNSGLTQYWYDRSGNLRYSQDSGDASLGQYHYRAYDDQGRLKSAGLQTLSAMTQDIADQDDYAGGTRTEEVGYIYDDLSTFQARTGFTLDAVMPYYRFLDGTHSMGRLVCAYNRNSENSTYPFTDQDKFVADFYDYDERGRLARTLKSVQPIRDADMKYQDGYFTYDENDRLIETLNYVNAPSGTLSTQHTYAYDSLGRLSQVKGLSNQPLAHFKYYDFGPIQEVLLGGDGTGTKGTRVEYLYNARGAVQEIRATDLSTSKIVYQDILGYDVKSNSAAQVPNPLKPRFNGTLSQELYRFTDDLNSQNPVRLVNYDYDGLGRMIKADYRKNTGTQPFYSDGTINFSSFSWNTTSQDQSSSFSYDLNGRITGQRSSGIPASDSARYAYRPNSYQLDSILGKVSNIAPRDMGYSGAFTYDAHGNMDWDGSKGMSIGYNWNQQPIWFSVDGLTYGYVDVYYDASGNRVFSRVDDNSQALCKYYLNMGAGISKEYEEILDSYTLAVKSTSMTVNLFANSQVGRLRNDGVYEFFLKNHLGSTMKTMGVMGGSPLNGGASYDYLAYGDVRKLKETGNTVTQKYTGKEYEDLIRLEYFGARWSDPELGIWLSVDPSNQYVNPFSFVGGNPINVVDPDGKDGIWINGVGGQDDDELRKKLCNSNPDACTGDDGTNPTSWGQDYGYTFTGDLLLAATGLGGPVNLPELIPQVERIYRESRAHHRPLVIYGHSGGAASSGWATGYLNIKYGLGTVNKRVIVNGADAFWLGEGLSSSTGTKTDSYYNSKDPISYFGFVWDATNPASGIFEPEHNLNAFNLDRWCTEGGGPLSAHSSHAAVTGGCRSVNDILKDNVPGYSYLATGLDFGRRTYGEASGLAFSRISGSYSADESPQVYSDYNPWSGTITSTRQKKSLFEKLFDAATLH